MQPYRNTTSGVTAYTLHATTIDIQFRDGKRYRYDRLTPGPEHVAAMKRRAVAGHGLATYINQHVRQHFAARLGPGPGTTTPTPR